mmetsp:Transcript_19913/g.43250  ORF Transcript_19913/g.43250 Transcript_19913/m.43250 type:complete len:260 (-) Transcript_19913:117-896(-)
MLNLAVAMNTEPERGHLARSIAHSLHHASELCTEMALEKLSLKSGECDTQTKIDLRPRIHRKRLVLVGQSQLLHGVAEIRWPQRGELRSEDALSVGFLPSAGFVHVRNDVCHHLKADIFTFSIAIQPQNQALTIASLCLQVLWQPCGALEGSHDVRREELLRTVLRPVVVLLPKVKGVDVTRGGGDFEKRLLATELSPELVYGRPRSYAMTLSRVAMTKSSGQGLGDGRLLSDHEYGDVGVGTRFHGCCHGCEYDLDTQ